MRACSVVKVPTYAHYAYGVVQCHFQNHATKSIHSNFLKCLSTKCKITLTRLLKRLVAIVSRLQMADALLQRCSQLTPPPLPPQLTLKPIRNKLGVPSTATSRAFMMLGAILAAACLVMCAPACHALSQPLRDEGFRMRMRSLLQAPSPAACE